MRPVQKLPHPLDANGNPKSYSPYGKAKPDLVANLGDYCSYCEVFTTFVAIEVEHILPKSAFVALQEEWNNFLLSCKTCNTIKSDTIFDLSDIHLPHQNNTAISLQYQEGGTISVPPALSNLQQEKVKKLINLVGLDRVPGHPLLTAADKRWHYRRQAWELAMRYLAKFEAGQADEDTVCDLASQRGFWSVWMSVFAVHSSVRQKMIEKFVGTAATCFDATTTPIFRNGLEP